jgi:hypothetical protein
MDAIYKILAKDQLAEYDRSFDKIPKALTNIRNSLIMRHPYYNHINSLAKDGSLAKVWLSGKLWWHLHDSKTGKMVVNGRWLLIQGARRYKAYGLLSRDECETLCQMILSPGTGDLIMAETIIKIKRLEFKARKINKLKKQRDGKKLTKEIN